MLLVSTHTLLLSAYLPAASMLLCHMPCGHYTPASTSWGLLLLSGGLSWQIASSLLLHASFRLKHACIRTQAAIGWPAMHL